MTEQKPYPSILQGFGVILVVIAFFFLSELLIKLIIVSFDINTSGNALYKSSEELLLYVLPVGAALLFAYRKRKRSGNTKIAGFKPFSPAVFLVSFLAVFCIGYLLEPFQYFVPIPDNIIKLLEEALCRDFLTIFTNVVTAPVLEELLMRGIILDGFLQRYSPSKSIIWSAVIFGLFHLNPWQAVGGLAISLLLGWLYWKTKSLLLCIVLHAANNGMVVLLSFTFEMDNADTLIDYMGMGNYFIGFAIVLILLTGCMRFLNKRLRKQVYWPPPGSLPQ